MVSGMAIDKMADCPALRTIRLISGKWKTRILWHLRSGPAGFGELQRALGTVSSKVLADHLDALVEAGLISRASRQDKGVTASVYAYSEFGRTLVPVLDALGEWSLAHAPDPEAAIPR